MYPKLFRKHSIINHSVSWYHCGIFSTVLVLYLQQNTVVKTHMQLTILPTALVQSEQYHAERGSFISASATGG
jgi:hypothetical protein